MTLVTDIDAAAAYIRGEFARVPSVGIILGSGLGDMAESVEDSVHIPYREIPNFAPSTVEGHKGELVLGTLEGKTVAVLQGRLHAGEVLATLVAQHLRHARRGGGDLPAHRRLAVQQPQRVVRIAPLAVLAHLAQPRFDGRLEPRPVVRPAGRAAHRVEP